ncbi:porin [Methylophaga nitratireducenticrescens]|uniref:Outer membrane protein (Porin) n=1 Tax=Methylophaga nitratireducenticrescens TaxID=754476 RepID=I1XLM3_METNJ|nr:porin [Methylophaga nitratireducenticrescens]AFI85292.1 porin [Methylophaga nitratireducenticrescens]AUZ85887.1 porin [Methylophaga nitratireducenticrescens]
MKKTTLATLVGAAAFAAAGAANATIVVGGENGYEFSVDGNINQFFIASDQDSANGAYDQNNQGVANGLLPTFFGFNVKAPEINGLTVAARVSISPSTNNGSYFNSDNGNASGNMEQREAFATVDGAFGQIMLGKGLGLYAANNILLDQTLYGVGATSVIAANDQNTGTTSLGRIGWGYEYANWRSQIRWTSVDMAGFKVALAVADGDDFLEARDAAGYEKDARYEASLSYGTAFDGGSAKLWLDGMTQKVSYANLDSIKANAYTVGGQLVLGGFEAVAAYYDGKGQGIGGLGLGAFKNGGSDARDGDGYYAQLGYRFGGQTFVAGSYGESTLERDDSAAAGSNFGDLDTNSMYTIGVYHDVTANLKLVAEYSRMETEYHLQSDEDEVDVLAIGGFISW